MLQDRICFSSVSMHIIDNFDGLKEEKLNQNGSDTKTKGRVVSTPMFCLAFLLHSYSWEGRRKKIINAVSGWKLLCVCVCCSLCAISGKTVERCGYCFKGSLSHI